MTTPRARLTAALFALLLASCAPAVPSVHALHTIPPQYSIVPAKVVAVSGPRDDDFVERFVAELRKRALQVVDERATATADVVVRVQPPDCSIDEDEDEETWQADCPAAVRAAAIAPDVPRYQEALSRLEQWNRDAETAKKSRQTLDAEAAAEVAARKAALEAAEKERREAAKERAANIRKTALNTPAGVSFLLIPAGTFTMGCTEGDAACMNNERPPHAVTISKPFYLAFTPTTNYQYQQCIDAGACGGTADVTRRLNPVVNVSWSDARDFCTWAGGRLPTEAKEPDAEAGDVRITAGWQGGYADAAVTDPRGPASGERRIVRGGSWTATSFGVRVSVRYALPPNDAHAMVGFRCAR